MLPSSFGLDHTTMGPELGATRIWSSPRRSILEFRERFYRCTQHDHKTFDFNGRVIPAGGITGSQPLLTSLQSPVFVPLDQRRPSNPYRLARVVVQEFTGLVFGHDRWPVIRDVDPETQDFADSLVKASHLRSVMLRARNLGGSVGTVGLSWAFIEGKPRVRVHNGKNLHVHKWRDRDALIPDHVMELYQTPRDEWDPEKRTIVRRWYWFRRDWTPVADVRFHEVEVTKNEPIWRIDEEATIVHGDGFTHFVWVQNLPDEDETSIDGQPDYAELYEQANELDTLNSVVSRGAKLNLDPTLVLKMDRALIDRFGVRKGSENALAVGESGDANYLELAGTSITAGVDLFKQQRGLALEVAQCVIPDPNTITAAGTSSVALKVIYAPMLGKATMLRTQYGSAIERLLEQMIASAKAIYSITETVIETDEQGNKVESEVSYGLSLPPRIIREPIFDEDGRPTGKETVKVEERTPGNGGDLDLEWDDFFAPTANDRLQAVQTVTTATVGKPVLSQRGGAMLVSAMFGLDATSEIVALEAAERAKLAAQDSMFYGTGGDISTDHELAEVARAAGQRSFDAEHEPSIDEEEHEPSIDEEEHEPSIDEGRVLVSGKTAVELTSTDLASIVTVNEGRRGAGLGPLMRSDGTIDPDGNLTIKEFQAKREAKGATEGDYAAKRAAGVPLVDPPKVSVVQGAKPGASNTPNTIGVPSKDTKPPGVKGES